jgi:hypothetical protein
MSPELESGKSQVKVNFVDQEQKLGVVGWYGFSYGL